MNLLRAASTISLFTLASRVTGFNINGGRRVDIGTYVVRP